MMNLFLTPHQKAQQASFDNAVAVSKYLDRKNRKAEKAADKKLLSKFRANQTMRQNPVEMALENQELYGA